MNQRRLKGDRETTDVKRRMTRWVVMVGSGAVVLQFGGCLSDVLADVFFIVGPFLL